MDDFVYFGNWFDKYRFLSGERYVTFKAALNLLRQQQLVRSHIPYILETGCARLQDDWGGGMSSLLFAEYAKTYVAHLVSVDISEESCSMAREILKDFDPTLYTIVQDDSLNFLDESVKYLKSSKTKVDLLYLDSYDYPYGELLNEYGGREDIDAAIATLSSMTESEIVEAHGDIIRGSQEHCLKEIQAAMPLLHDKSIVLIDDNALPGGGKPRLAKRWLAEQGWTCLIDSQQSLWIKQ